MQQYYRPICIVSRTAKKMFENTERAVIYYEEKISSFHIVWNDGTYSYSVSTSNGMSKNALLKIVKQVQ